MKLLQEYGEPVFFEGDPVELSTGFEQANERWAERLETDSIFDIRTHKDGVSIKAKGVLGQLTIQDREIEIAPKYIPASDLQNWRETVFDVLRFSQSTDFGFSGPASGRLAETSFVDILARGFLQALEPEIDQGSPTEYQRTKFRSETVEGELIVDRLYPQILTDPTNVWVEASHLTSDTVLGRALRFAARRFATLTTVPALRGRLIDIDERLSDAKPTAPSIAALDRYFLPPQFRSFEDAFEIASWLIRDQGAGLGGESMVVEGILLKSHSMYQDFVHRCLEHVVRHRGWDIDGEPSTTVATGPKNVTAFPDHVLSIEDRQVVLDSKYKGSTEWGTSGRAVLSAPNADDIYQITLAGRAIDAQEVALVYPAVTPNETWNVSGAGLPRTLHTLTVDPIAFHQNRELFFNELSTDIVEIVGERIA